MKRPKQRKMGRTQDAPRTLDQLWDKLAREVSQLAAAVECSPEEYRDGLQYIIDTLQMDIQASEETEGRT